MFIENFNKAATSINNLKMSNFALSITEPEFDPYGLTAITSSKGPVKKSL